MKLHTFIVSTVVYHVTINFVVNPTTYPKLNFVIIKPLLDQFQGCYNDNYRCFAGYYMICQLVIMTIITAN